MGAMLAKMAVSELVCPGTYDSFTAVAAIRWSCPGLLKFGIMCCGIKKVTATGEVNDNLRLDVQIIGCSSYRHLLDS